MYRRLGPMLLLLALAAFAATVATAVAAEQHDATGNDASPGEVVIPVEATSEGALSAETPASEAPASGSPSQAASESPATDPTAASLPTGEASPAPSPAACPSAQLLVKPRPGADPNAIAARHGGTVVQVIPGIQVAVVEVPATSADATLAALQSDPDVVYAEPNGVVRIPELPPGPSPCP
ncbi:MAG: hypothetical protein IT305_04735 [Chloroflexi bacterium]|nr:hypothetical protein [Chloroflexota bacterium]